MKETKQKSTFFYGWLIVVGCMLIQAIPYSLAANIQSSFTSYVTEAEGFTYTQFSLIFTIGTVVSALCANASCKAVMQYVNKSPKVAAKKIAIFLFTFNLLNTM